jgi:hypothetical protein
MQIHHPHGPKFMMMVFILTQGFLVKVGPLRVTQSDQFEKRREKVIRAENLLEHRFDCGLLALH